MNEYTIDEHGVTLTTPWQDADHLNVRTESGTVNFHAEAKCAALPAPPECSPIMQTAAQKIGQNFISWGDLGISPESCIEWVQFSRANYHYGENGEQAFCLTKPEPVKPLGYIPEIAKDCDGATWSHPATTTGVGAPARYEISVNGGAKQAYTPGDVVSLIWPEDGSTNVVSLFGYYDSGFWHQIGQSKIANTVTCEVEPPVTPPVDPPTVVPPVEPIDVPTTIQPALDPPAELAVTGGFDLFPVLLGAAVMIAAGGVLFRKAFAR